VESRHRAANNHKAIIITSSVLISESETPEQKGRYKGGYESLVTSEETCEGQYADAVGGGNCNAAA